MPCNAFSAVCLRSSSIQPCRTSTIIASSHMPPFSAATASSHLRTAGSLPREATKRGRARRAYGNSTSLTKEMLLVVPSMSVRMARMGMVCALESKIEGRASFAGTTGNPGLRGSGVGRASARLALLVTREALGDIGAGEMADPAVRLGEEADRDEARLRPHVEPVLGAVGHGDQVALLALDLVDLVLDMQREQA